MAIRTTHSKVQDILGDHYDGSMDLTAFIVTANSLVDFVSSRDADGIHSSASLELVERWLAAHFYGHADQFHQSEGEGGANATFQGQTEMVFNSTQYGQTAVALDFTGVLAEIQEGRRKGSMLWLGTRYKNDKSERTSDQ